MRRFATSVAIGATGMLAGALAHVVANSDRTIVVARHASKAIAGLRQTIALDLNWRDTAAFRAALEPTLASSVDLALLWMHGSGDAALSWLLDRLKPQDCLVIHVLSSMASDPAAFRDALDREATRCRYRTVRLGAIALTAGGSRWLNDEEVSVGIVRAIDTASDVTIGIIPQ